MPSHLNESDSRPEGVSLLDIRGNDFADNYAKQASRLVQVSLTTARKCIHYYNLVKKIQHRLAAIIQNLPDRKKYMTVRTVKETQKVLETKIHESAHNVTKIGGRYTCINCKNSFLQTDTSLQEWLQTSCSILPTTNRPTSIDNDALHIGNLSIHSSHKLATHRGLVYCKRCGSRVGTCLQNLAKVCAPPGSYGKLSLKAINDDNLPPNLDSWPAE